MERYFIFVLEKLAQNSCRVVAGETREVSKVDSAVQMGEVQEDMSIRKHNLI